VKNPRWEIPILFIVKVSFIGWLRKSLKGKNQMNGGPEIEKRQVPMKVSFRREE